MERKSAYVNTYLNKRVVTRTPQSQPVPGKEHKMSLNNAGGYTFTVDPWQKLERFLILGSESGTFYVSEKEHTYKNIKSLEYCITTDCKRTVDVIVAISDAGRAPKNDPALFALAMCASFGDDKGKQYALANLRKVARIGTHLFHFASYLNGMRGWGRGVRTAIGKWYTERTPDNLSFMLAKYQTRDGWSNENIIRLSHPKASSEEVNALLAWAVGKYDRSKHTSLIGLVYALELMKSAVNEKEVIALINAFHMPQEVVPTEYRKSIAVWEAMLPNLGYTAILRNLGNMGSYGVLDSSESRAFVYQTLVDEDKIKKGRVHPLAIAVALAIYSSGSGMRGSNSWKVTPMIKDALEIALLKSFGYIEPTGKTIAYCLDWSGSMTGVTICNSPLTCATATAILSLACAKSELDYHFMAFDNGIRPLNITKHTSFEDAIRETMGKNGGGTDCSLPARWAREQKLVIDAFVIMTDNETWAGKEHPIESLNRYRQQFNPQAKQIVVGMVSTDFTIADPDDLNSLDIVGFDTATPSMMSNFIRGGHGDAALSEQD